MSRVHGSGVWVNLGKNILARLVCVCLIYFNHGPGLRVIGLGLGIKS